ncbi:MAG: S-methyl-5-thioribose-1-phosphate isomerase [Planctomycetes bacterium]|nr:S-methyl-5-thioribose-1-phosphate isomerase [Planctomycetota bacterium]
MPVDTIHWEGDRPGFARIIDQTLLPTELKILDLKTVDDMFDAIKRLAVRGAPAIGVAAGYGVLLGIQGHANGSADDVFGRTKETCAWLARARPTAVNLFWALERMAARAARDYGAKKNGREIVDGLFDEAHTIWREDREICRKIGAVGADLLKDGDTVLTHCNAGALATADYGTALAPIYVARDQGKTLRVFADETRPLLQGARLTAWELHEAKIDVTLITDNMAGRVMFEGKIDAVFVGADRIAKNGDTANKIGTYSVAVLAREHGIPFYVCAPLSTFDTKIAHGDEIPIEERGADEITQGFGKRTAPLGVKVYNPAFDVTPARFIRGIITEVGIIERPNTARVEEALRRGGRL